MRDARIAVLADRGVVSVSGEDARKLLSGIITNDIELLDDRPAIFAGLLSPQGKVLFEFFVVQHGDGLLLDADASQVGDLVKRLTLYKLRAKATIADAGDVHAVVAAWNGSAQPGPAAVTFVDPRHAGLGQRFIVARDKMAAGLDPAATSANAAVAYHGHRISLGIPEGGKDYDFGEAFPHEANFDLLNGVSFEKGCYVGQEIVARMKHRGTVRKRVVRVTGTADLPASRPGVQMGDVAIGRLGSVAGKIGLAVIRLDRAIEAIDQGLVITADGVPLEIDAEMIARQRAQIAAKDGTP